MACSPRHHWCGHVKAGDTHRKTAQITLKWRACCLLPVRRANGWRRRKPLIPRERRSAWRNCAGQRRHHEYFVSSRQPVPYLTTEGLPVIHEIALLARGALIGEDQWALAAARPAPHTGFVTAILSKFETTALPRGIEFLTAGKDRDASRLAMLSHTSVTHIVF